MYSLTTANAIYIETAGATNVCPANIATQKARPIIIYFEIISTSKILYFIFFMVYFII